jgi:serine/threonine protein kinase
MDTDQAEPITEVRPNAARDGVKGWLDALAKGDCDEADFLRRVQRLTRKSSEAGWDTLSLLDQYYRLGRIPASVFNSLRESLGSQLVENDADDGAVPLTRVTPEQPQPDRAQPDLAQPDLAQPDRAQPDRAQPDRAQAGRTRPARAQPARVLSAQRQAPAPSHRQRQSPARRQRQPPALRQTSPPAPSAGAAPEPVDLATPSASGTGSVRALAHEIALGDLLRERYEIEGVLGRGETGTVFEAADRHRLDLPGLGQRVALKVLHAPVAARSAWRAALRRQFQLMQSLSHPNIVRTYDYDRDGDIDFFTMECLRGLSLSGVLSARNERALDRPFALAIIRDVGAALAHAHSRSVVHGDLNPANIFITNEGEVRVLDFGAVHAPSRAPSVSSSQADPPPRAASRYASCQVLEGGHPDARDDLYALACVAYVLLAGKHPFADQTAAQAREQRLKPRRPSRVTAREWRALRVGLDPDRERRTADVATWLTAFDWRTAASPLPAMAALVRGSSRPPRATWPAIVLTSTALLAAGLWAIWNLDSLDRVVAPAGTALRAALSGSGASGPRVWGTARPHVPAAADGARAPSPAGGDSAATAMSSTSTADARPTGPTAVPGPDVATRTQAVRSAAGVVAPGVGTSGVGTSGVGTSGVGTSGIATPGIATPGIAIPGTVTPGVVTPGIARQGIVTQGVVAQGIASPAVASRAVVGPGVSPPPAASRAPAVYTTAASPNPNNGASGARIELAADTVEVPPSDPAARVVVRRKGNLRGEASFSWWTESGTARPEHDFIPVAAHRETIEDGKSSADLFIPVVGDANRREPKSFYVVIDDPSSGTSLGARTLTLVTIPPTE